MDRMVWGVVRQQPPTSDAPASHHLFTYETKSLSEIPVCCCKKSNQTCVRDGVIIRFLK